jgi:fibronectin type 3 domain-containing protein
MLSVDLPNAAATSIVYDQGGVAHVAYYDTSASALMYTTRDTGGVWSAAVTVDANPMAAPQQLSLALDSSGQPAIAYYDAALGDLKYARPQIGGAWSSVIVDAKGNAGLNPSLAFDRVNNPFISYYAATPQQLRLATLSHSHWKITTLASRKNASPFSTLSINPLKGSWAVAYETATTHHVMLARKGQSAVSVGLLSGGAPAFAPGLAFNPSNQPLITYSDPMTGALFITQLRGRKWSPSAADSSAAAAGDLSLQIDPITGTPLMVYASQSGQVNLITQHQSGWTTSPLGVGADVAAAIDPLTQSLATLIDGSFNQVSPGSPAPLNFIATPQDASVQLTWVAASVADTAFLVQRSIGGAGWTDLVTTPLTSYLDTPADEGTAYSYRIFALTGDISSVDAAVASATLGPDAPTDLTASATASGVQLNWTNQSAIQTGFVVQRSFGAGSWQTITTTDAVTTSYLDTSAVEGTGYNYRVFAVDNSLSSAILATASATMLPAAPSALGASISQSPAGVQLSWADNSHAESGFLIQRSDSNGPWNTLTTTSPDITNYLDATASEGGNFQYRVFAVQGGSQSSTAATASIALPPSTPTNLTDTLTAQGPQLDWTDNSALETGYLVQRQTIGSAWTTLATIAANSVTYTDTTAVGGTAYNYQVIAAGSGANSAPSNSVYLVAPVPLQAPANAVATPVSDTEVNLTWDRVSPSETSMTIWRSTGGGAYTKLTVLAAGTNIYTDTSCYPSTAYSYQVTADNVLGSSPPSNTVTATTMASAATMPNSAAGNFTATAVSPFTVNLSWTDSASGSRNWFLERSANGGAYSIIAVIASSGTAVTYTDSPLSPSTTYSYRVRLTSGSAFGDYSAPVTATTQARVANTPLEPTNFTATVNSATSTTLTWTDTSGGSASYLIETAPFSWTNTPTWTQVGQTAAGATSYNLTTTAETFYYVRIRAHNATGNSGYTQQVAIRSASPGLPGGPHVYKIGPGQTYTSLAALDWTKLGPGDTVQIYPNKDAGGNIIPYFEKPLISVRGTAAAPINIVGMPDPTTGQLPIIDGTNAITAAQWNSHYMPLEDLSLVMIGTRASQNAASGAWSPGYFNLQNLDIRNGYSGDPGTTLTYTASDGTVRPYSAGAVCGIYIEKGDHITIKGCTIHGNNEGMFGAGQGDQRNLENLTIDSNYIYGNGTINSSQTHNSYLEGINTIYQFNKYGPLRTGSLGGGLKDRSAGTIIRYNYVTGGGHLLDLVEAQNYAPVTLTLPSYRTTLVYGNIFYNANGAAVTPIHYGGDTLPSPYFRKGVLDFYNNTFVNQEDVWRTNVFDLQTGADSLDARDNIIWFQPGTKNNTIELLTDVGTAYFGRNWITPGWTVSRGLLAPFSGRMAGAGNLINNAQNDPGFVSVAAQNFGLTTLSQCVDQEDTLTGDELPVLLQYADPMHAKSRTVNGNALDLGAFEQGL